MGSKKITILLWILALTYMVIPMYTADAEEVKRTYYFNGNLKSEANYDNGSLNGMYRKFYENGSLCSELHYTDGVPDGLGLEFYRNGVLQSAILYENGKMLDCKLFNMSGQLIADSCLSLTLEWKYGVIPYPVPGR